MNASVLAQHASFSIGPVEIRPPTRTVARDGVEEIVEPRVMQVLVALADAEGAVVGRDDLVERCWDGRVVGDDAINRVMSRLRRLAGGIAHDAFAIETVTKVGYRLRLIEAGAADPETRGSVGRARHWTRRQMIGWTAAAAAGVAGAATLAGGVDWRRLGRYRPTQRTQEMMRAATLELRQSTREGQSQAIGLYRQVVADEPGFADGWATLALTYAMTARYRAGPEAGDMDRRARQASARALAIEPGNPLASAAIALGQPLFGNWLGIERALRDALEEEPRHEQLLIEMINLLGAVGRSREALDYCDRFTKIAPPTPAFFFWRVRLLWSTGRLEEADALMDDADRIFPTHFAVWFNRFYISMFSGRPDAAIAFAANRSQRPSNIPDEEVDAVVRVAQAMQSRASSEIDLVIDEWLARARSGAGHAENAAQFAAALGRPDTALAILEAYYFGKGFTVPEVRFSTQQGTYTPHNDRQTVFLFNPSLANVQRLPAFAQLTGRLGLNAYWRAAGHRAEVQGQPIA